MKKPVTKKVSKHVDMKRDGLAIITLAEAKAAGIKHYFTGMPCPKGHLSKRSVANRDCRRCCDLRARSTPEKRQALNKRGREYWASTIDVRRAQLKRSQDKHRDQRRADCRAQYLKNKKRYFAYALAWAKTHRGIKNNQTARYRAQLRRAMPHWLTRAHIKEMSEIYRTASARGLQVDHVVPLRGKTVCGLHVPWNLQHLSASDNAKKSNILMEDERG